MPCGVLPLTGHQIKHPVSFDKVKDFSGFDSEMLQIVYLSSQITVATAVAMEGQRQTAS